MKKTLFLGFVLSFFGQFDVSSQTICDSISVQNIVLDVNTIDIQVYNSSQHMIVYPFFKATLDENPYITMEDTLKVLSFLSVAGDANNGFSNALYSNVVFAEASTVPANTLFTGELVITDPNDSTFSCTKPFSFTYGTATAATPEMELAKLQVFPNPTKEKWTLISPVSEGNLSMYDFQGKLVLAQSIQATLTTLEFNKQGIYILKVESSTGSWIEKISIQ